MDEAERNGTIVRFKTVDQERLNSVIDKFLFTDPHFWIDGYIFKLVVALNAMEIPTRSSCEGNNPMHKFVYAHGINLPSIDICMNEESGDNYPAAALNTLIEEFSVGRECRSFVVSFTAGKLEVLPTSSNDHSEGLTVEHYNQAMTELNAFVDFLREKVFAVGVNFEEALRVNMGDVTSVTGEEDIPAGIYPPGALTRAVTEYRSKGFEEMTVMGVIARTVAKLAELRAG